MNPETLQKWQPLYDDFMASGLSRGQYYEQRQPCVCRTYFNRIIREIEQAHKSRQERDVVQVVHLDDVPSQPKPSKLNTLSRKVTVTLTDQTSITFESPNPELFALQALCKVFSGVRL